MTACFRKGRTTGDGGGGKPTRNLRSSAILYLHRVYIDCTNNGQSDITMENFQCEGARWSTCEPHEGAMRANLRDLLTLHAAARHSLPGLP